MTNFHDSSETYLTPAEVAAQLRVSRGTVYRLIESGLLRARRIGGQWRIPESAVDEVGAEEREAV